MRKAQRYALAVTGYFFLPFGIMILTSQRTRTDRPGCQPDRAAPLQPFAQACRLLQGQGHPPFSLLAFGLDRLATRQKRGSTFDSKGQGQVTTASVANVGSAA